MHIGCIQKMWKVADRILNVFLFHGQVKEFFTPPQNTFAKKLWPLKYCCIVLNSKRCTLLSSEFVHDPLMGQFVANSYKGRVGKLLPEFIGNIKYVMFFQAF